MATMVAKAKRVSRVAKQVKTVAKRPAVGKVVKKVKPDVVEETPKLKLKPKKTTVWDRLLDEDEIKQG